jgi:hypothetical protein
MMRQVSVRLAAEVLLRTSILDGFQASRTDKVLQNRRYLITDRL